MLDRLLDDRLAAPLVRDDEPGGGVEDQAAAAEQDECGEGDAVDDRADAEVRGQPGGDARDDAAFGRADELPLGVGVGVGASRVVRW